MHRSDRRKIESQRVIVKVHHLFHKATAVVSPSAAGISRCRPFPSFCYTNRVSIILTYCQHPWKIASTSSLKKEGRITSSSHFHEYCGSLVAPVEPQWTTDVGQLVFTKHPWGSSLAYSSAFVPGRFGTSTETGWGTDDLSRISSTKNGEFEEKTWGHQQYGVWWYLGGA